jgi:hypothetical protein
MFSVSDYQWLQASRYALTSADGTLTGRLHFDMAYDPADNSCTINPSPSLLLEKGVIHHVDEYEVKIAWDAIAPWPLCYEKSGKILALARERQMPLSDLHVNSSGDFCLAPFQDLHLDFDDGFTIQLYIEKYVIPFLFQQTHFRKKGQWAWPPAEHGAAGMYTWYAEHAADAQALRVTIDYLARQLKVQNTTVVKMIRRRPYKGHMKCLCDSGKRIRKCCPAALYAYNALRRDLIQSEVTQ